MTLDWLAGKPPGSTCLCLPRTGIIGMFHHTQLSTWVLGFQHILTLTRQVLTNQDITPTPTFKAKVDFYDFVLSDKHLTEVTRN